MYRHQLIIQTQGHFDPLSLCKSWALQQLLTNSWPFHPLLIPLLTYYMYISYSHTTSYFYSIPPLFAPPLIYLLAIGLLLAYHGIFFIPSFFAPFPLLIKLGFFCFKLPSPAILCYKIHHPPPCLAALRIPCLDC